LFDTVAYTSDEVKALEEELGFSQGTIMCVDVDPMKPAGIMFQHTGQI
jgi:hypothetical protein